MSNEEAAIQKPNMKYLIPTPLPSQVSKLTRVKATVTFVAWCNGTSLTQIKGLELYTGKAKDWRHRQIRKITDRVFDNVKNDSGRANLKFEDLYIAVLLVYNGINKLLPGPHVDPPSKDIVREIIEDCDINFDGEIDREEFYSFIMLMTVDTVFNVISQRILVTLMVAPTVALATKRATEGVPGVGKVVKRLPDSAYASLVTLVFVWLQKLEQDSE